MRRESCSGPVVSYPSTKIKALRASTSAFSMRASTARPGHLPRNHWNEWHRPLEWQRTCPTGQTNLDHSLPLANLSLCGLADLGTDSTDSASGAQGCRQRGAWRARAGRSARRTAWYHESRSLDLVLDRLCISHRPPPRAGKAFQTPWRGRERESGSRDILE